MIENDKKISMSMESINIQRKNCLNCQKWDWTSFDGKKGQFWKDCKFHWSEKKTLFGRVYGIFPWFGTDSWFFFSRQLLNRSIDHLLCDSSVACDSLGCKIEKGQHDINHQTKNTDRSFDANQYIINKQYCIQDHVRMAEKDAGNAKK